MRRKSCDVASPTKNSPIGRTPPPQSSRPYHYPGRSPPGDSTWWAHSRNHQREEEHTCSSRSTSSLNGSKAVPITSSTALTAVNFIKSIIFRFGVPHNIITDNGTNFTATEFQNFCEELGIKINYASVAHPQSNGQVEKANGLVCGVIKKRLLAPLEQAVGN